SKFRDLLAHVQRERRRLLPRLDGATQEALRLGRKQKAWQEGWFLKRVFPSRYARIRHDASVADARQGELAEEERLSRLQTQSDLPDHVRGAYGYLVDAFADLTRCERKWDTVSRASVDSVRERPAASHSIERKPVVFDLGSCELIESEWRVP